MLLRPRAPRRILLAALAVALLVFAAGCGDDDSGSSGAETTSSARATGPGNGTDLAFVTDMILHHEGAVDMAKVALDRGESDFLKELAETINRTQTQEIATLRQLKSELEQNGIQPQQLSHKMDMDMGVAGLHRTEPFDQAFVDVMIPHHRDAILMAREVLENGESVEVRQLAEAIIEAQSTEIDEMNSFREDTYGAASPAGGVPDASDSDLPAVGPGGGHDGM